MAAFEDITVVDLDLQKTTWSRVHSSMRTLYLKLSREPDLGWIRAFNTERESRVVPTRHGLWIEEGYIIFDCLLQNVETLHLPDFQQSIDYANARSHEAIVERREERAQQRAEFTEEHGALQSLRAKIRSIEPATAEPAKPADETAAASPVVDAAPDAASDATESVAATIDAAPVNAEVVEPTLPVDAKAANDDDDFDVRRNEWRARFRQALASRKENDRGNPQ